MSMTVTIELTEQEARFLQSFCLLRPIKAAVEHLYRFEDMEYIAEDLEEAGPIYENIRFKLVHQLGVYNMPTTRTNQINYTSAVGSILDGVAREVDKHAATIEPTDLENLRILNFEQRLLSLICQLDFHQPAEVDVALTFITEMFVKHWQGFDEAGRNQLPN